MGASLALRSPMTRHDDLVLATVYGGLSLQLKEAAADRAHARYAAAISAWPRTEAHNAELRKIARFFKTLVDGHLRD